MKNFKKYDIIFIENEERLKKMKQRKFDIMFSNNQGTTYRYTTTGETFSIALYEAENKLRREHPSFKPKSTNVCERSN